MSTTWAIWSSNKNKLERVKNKKICNSFQNKRYCKTNKHQVKKMWWQRNEKDRLLFLFFFSKENFQTFESQCRGHQKFNYLHCCCYYFFFFLFCSWLQSKLTLTKEKNTNCSTQSPLSLLLGWNVLIQSVFRVVTMICSSTLMHFTAYTLAAMCGPFGLVFRSPQAFCAKPLNSGAVMRFGVQAETPHHLRSLH